ncbi:MAG: lysostaphin resistance A-like protein [Halobaculum sp.]
MSEVTSVPSESHANDDGGPARAVGVALALWLVGVGGGLLLAGVAGAVVGLLAGGAVAVAALVGQGLFAVTTTAVGAGYARRYLDGLRVALPTGESLRLVAGGVAGTVVVWALNAGLTAVLGVDTPTSRLTSGTSGPLVTAGLLAYVVVVAPVAEETLFRGAVQARLRRAVGRWPAVVGGSVLFLSVHAFNFVGGSALGTALAFATLFGVSLVFGYVYDRADTLTVPVVVHAAYNATLVGGSLLLAAV